VAGSFRRCPAAHVGRTRRSLNSCAYRGRNARGASAASAWRNDCDRPGRREAARGHSVSRRHRVAVALILARAVLLRMRCADGNIQMAIWGQTLPLPPMP
jgi:hypothetical protein